MADPVTQVANNVGFGTPFTWAGTACATAALLPQGGGAREGELCWVTGEASFYVFTAGGWTKLPGTSPTSGAYFIVPLSTSLAGLPASLPNGALAFVVTQRAFYSWNAATANWDRFLSDWAFWTAQPAFFIADGSSPDNTGLSAGSPITHAEFTARIYAGNRANVSSVITVTFIGATYTGAVSIHATILSGGQLVYQGTRTTVSGGASAFTAFAARNAAANLPNLGTDAGQNWNANVGNLVVDTQAGPRFGAASFVAKQTAAGIGRLGSFLLFSPTTTVFSPTETTPLGTDTYAIQTLTQLTGSIDIDVDGPANLVTAGTGKFVADSFNFANANVMGAHSAGPSSYLTNCTVTAGGAMRVSGFQLVNVFANGGSIVQEAPSEADTTSQWGGGFLGANNNQLVPSDVFYRSGVLFQGFKLTVGNNAIANIADAGFFDAVGAVITATDGGNVTALNAAAIWGSTAGAGSFPLNAQQRGVVFNESGGTWALAVPMTTVSTTLGLDLSTTAAPVSATTWANLAVQNITIASLDLATGAAGFGGRVTNNRGGSGFQRSDVV